MSVPMKRFRSTRLLFVSTLALGLVGSALAQRPANVPQLSSRVGAAYTLYLDFAGFDFTGDWGGNDPTPGITRYDPYLGANGSFSAAQIQGIRETWARTAEKYTAFGINVTTVDPAAGRSDAQRQAYYDQQARFSHSIVYATPANGGGYTAGGVAFGGVARDSWDTSANGGAGSGIHTNYTGLSADSTWYASAAETIAHETAHTLGVSHASDNLPGRPFDAYSTNGGASGVGSYGPIMGYGEFAQRGLWRTGSMDNPPGSSENEVQRIYEYNTGIGGPFEDGIGNSFEEATPLTLSGDDIDASRAKGVVVPTSTQAVALGEENYQGGYFSFRSAGGTVTLTAHNGSSFLQDGVADPGMTLRNALRIYDSSHNLVATGIEDGETAFTTFTGNLSAGSYYAFVTSTGGFQSTFDPTAHYFNMGSYFLTGSGFAPVPEPASLIALAGGVAVFLRRRRRG